MKKILLLSLIAFCAVSANAQSPVINGLGSLSECVGSTMAINGTGLSNATAVTIGGTAVSSVVSNTDDEIIAVVGEGTTGHVEVTTANGTATSADIFVVNTLLPPVLSVVDSNVICKSSVVTLNSLGAAGKCLQLSGQSQYISVGKVLKAGSSYTKEAWVKTSSSGPGGIIASNSDALFIIGSKLFASNGGGAPVADTVLFPMDAWTHVAVTYDSATTTLTLYRNGNPVAKDTLSLPGSEDSIFIGQVGSIGRFFTGLVDEVRVWKVARSRFQLVAGMHLAVPENSFGLVAYYKLDEGLDATAYDASGHGNNGMIFNQAKWISPSDAPLDYAFYSWAPGNQTTSSVTLAPDSTTLYTLAVSDVNGCVTTDTIRVTVNTCVGMEKNNTVPTISIFPVPADGSITVFASIPFNKEMQLSVYDVTGKDVTEKISSREITGNEKILTIGINDLVPGFYFMKVKTGPGIMCARFVKH